MPHENMILQTKKTVRTSSFEPSYLFRLQAGGAAAGDRGPKATTGHEYQIESGAREG